MAAAPHPDAATAEAQMLVDHVERLVTEELHLIGQELMDALDRDHARRLAALTAMLDEVDEMLARRRSLRPGARAI